MNPASGQRRRTWLGWSLAALSSWAAAKKPEPSNADDEQEGPPPAASAAASAAKPKPAASLTVQVTGSDGKPVALAKVEFEFASGASLDRRTNKQGIAQVQPPSDGTATVRVIAVGWRSDQRDIVVKRGTASQLSIQLER